MRVGTNECGGVCVGVGRLVYIVFGFVCIAFMQALLNGISLIMILIAYPCLNVFVFLHLFDS